jgi:hypothetical protein
MIYQRCGKQAAKGTKKQTVCCMKRRCKRVLNILKLSVNFVLFFRRSLPILSTALHQVTKKIIIFIQFCIINVISF